ncbi:MAG: hypothetical protein IKW38_04655 [Kiritimatiellae bacterium]|nr:hypothetical protein [Kiritimatiellia bacterium]
METIEQVRLDENNAIIDHLEAVRQIVAKKCARCNGMCMGCAFDTLDQGMFPAHIDAALALMRHFNNDRREVINSAERRIQKRKAAWDEISKRDVD